MKRLSKLGLYLIFGAVALLPVHLMAGEQEEAAAVELLAATQFEARYSEAIDVAVDTAIQMQPELEAHKETLRKFYEKHMSAAALRPDVIKLYTDVFTAEELKELTLFYKTEIGQKTLDKVPEIMQRCMMLSQTRVMENIGELETMITESM